MTNVIPITAAKKRPTKAAAIHAAILTFDGLSNVNGTLAVVVGARVTRARTPAFHALVRQRLADPSAHPQSINAASDAIDVAKLPSYTAPSNKPTYAAGDEWRADLQWRIIGRDANGEPIRILRSNALNVSTFLLRHSAWAGVVAYDLFRECIVTRRIPPWPDKHRPATVAAGPWRDEDDALLAAWFQHAEQADFGADAIRDGLTIAAGKLEYHPVRAYLESLAWDGVKRIDTFLPVYFRTEDTAWERRIGPAWLRSCVARICKPGSQVDHALVLESEQGMKKSTGLEALVPEPFWYADSGIDVTSKDSYQNLRGVWLYCIGELASLAKGDVERWKNFLTSKHDHYRPSYGERSRDYLRQTVFCADTNKDRYLNDPTGGRRFWPAKVLSVIDVEAIRRDRDQLWAETVATYKAGESWWLDVDAELLAKEHQSRRMADEPWDALVAKWVNDPTREIWEEGGDGEMHSRIEAHDIKSGLLVADLMTHALKLKPEQMKGEASNRAAAILIRLGWTSRRCEVAGVRAVRWFRSES